MKNKPKYSKLFLTSLQKDGSKYLPNHLRGLVIPLCLAGQASLPYLSPGLGLIGRCGRGLACLAIHLHIHCRDCKKGHAVVQPSGEVSGEACSLRSERVVQATRYCAGRGSYPLSEIPGQAWSAGSFRVSPLGGGACAQPLLLGCVGKLVRMLGPGRHEDV